MAIKDEYCMEMFSLAFMLDFNFKSRHGNLMNLPRGKKREKNSKISRTFWRSLIDSVDAIRESIFKFATLMYAMGKELHQISRSRAERGRGSKGKREYPRRGKKFPFIRNFLATSPGLLSLKVTWIRREKKRQTTI